VRRSVGLHLFLTKHLSGSGRGWGWSLGWGFVLAYKILVVIVEEEGAVLGVSLGRCMVTSGKFDGWLC